MRFLNTYCFPLLAFCIMLNTGCVDHGQYVDLEADVTVDKPAYPSGLGPNVIIDAAHANFHTASGRYEPLANLLRNDGFNIEESHAKLTDSLFTSADIFMIANADMDNNGVSFTAEEVNALHRFVTNGGSLLLIADHTPFPAAILELAHAFSIEFYDVFADDGAAGLFTRKNGGLTSDTLLNGIDKIRTFSGSAFRIERSDYRPLLVMHDQWMMQRMDVNGLSAKEPANGLLMGAVMEAGDGKIAVFGEAAMFSAQRYGRWKKRMGFHARGAEENRQFILNVFRWLGEK